MSVLGGNSAFQLTCRRYRLGADLRPCDDRASWINNCAGKPGGLRLCGSRQCKGKQDQRGDGEKKRQNTNGNTHEEPPLPPRAGGTGCPRIRDRFRLSRLRTPSVSWLGGTAPRGLPVPAFETVVHAEFPPPYSRAAATGLHRLPGTESAVKVAKHCGVPARPGTTMLRVNDLAERACAREPRNKTLRGILAAPRAQVHARPPSGTQLHLERRFENLLEQLPLVHGGGRSDAQAAAVL